MFNVEALISHPNIQNRTNAITAAADYTRIDTNNQPRSMFAPACLPHTISYAQYTPYEKAPTDCVSEKLASAFLNDREDNWETAGVGACKENIGL